MAKNNGVENVYVHALLDGRDVPPASAVEYLNELEDKMKEIGVGKIASVMGRFYAMDRDNIWDRVEKAYAAIVYGEGIQADNAVEAVKASYETVDEDGKHLTDEFVLPTVIGGSEGRVKADDSVIFFNSALTVQERLHVHLLTLILTALRERTAFSSFTMYV